MFIRGLPTATSGDTGIVDTITKRPVQSFVFQPGGIADGNVYTDWATLYAELSSTQGLRTVLIDDSFTTPQIPAGTYNMRNVVLAGLLFRTTLLTVVEGVTFLELHQFDSNLFITFTGTTPPVRDIANNDLILLQRGAKLQCTSGYFFDLSTIGSGNNAIFALRDGAEFDDNGFEVLFVPNNTSAIIAPIGAFSTLNSNTIAGGATATLIVTTNANDQFGTASVDQPNFAGAIIFFGVTQRWNLNPLGNGGTAATGTINRVDNTAGPVGVTLPPAFNNSGQQIVIKNITAFENTITITAAGGDNIDGGTSVVIQTGYGSRTFVSDGIHTWNVTTTPQSFATSTPFRDSDSAGSVGTASASSRADHVHKVSASVTEDHTQQALVDAATVAWDAANGRHATLLTTSGVGATRKIGNITNPRIGSYYELKVTTHAASGIDITWDTNYEFKDGVAPHLPGPGGLFEMYYNGSKFVVTAKVQDHTIYNIRVYGAVGDGTTDDSVAVQAAITAAEANGGWVYVPPGTYSIGTAANPFGDGLGGVKINNRLTIRGDGALSMFKKAAASNYILRMEGGEQFEMSGVALDIAANNNFVVALHLSKSADIYLHDNLFTNSLIPGGANWTLMAVLCDGGHDIRVVNNRFVRCQLKVGTNGFKTLVANNTFINPYNQGISWVFATNLNNSELTIIGNYIEGAADSGIFFGQDTGTTAGTFNDVLIADNIINGWSSNRGILGRYGSINNNWNIHNNKLLGGGFKATTVASQTPNTFTVNGGDGASYPASGWGYLELGTVREELIQYTRSGDVFTSDHNFYFTHANGCEFWALTGTIVGATLGIDITPAADNAGGPMVGLQITGNRVSNVDQEGISVGAPSLVSEWSIENNHIESPSRGIRLASSLATNLWAAGSISGNVMGGYQVYGIHLLSIGGVHGTVLINGNVINGDGTSNSISALRIEGTNAGTIKAHVTNNIFTGQAGFSETGGVFEKTDGTAVIDTFYSENDLRGNSTAATFTASAIVRNNRGFITENKGTGQINSGATSVVITHGLSVTPAAQDISISLTSLSTTDPGEIYLNTFTSTQFTVNCRTNPGVSNITFGWRAQVL